MPDKICPVCGEKLVKDGFDIPFETFQAFLLPEFDLSLGLPVNHEYGYTYPSPQE